MSPAAAKPRVLLHACCAGCCTVPLQRLHERYEVTVYFYGPNIQPRGEYLRRLEDQRRLCRQQGIRLVEGAYRPAEWGRAVLLYRSLPEGSQRCEACYRLRMEQTAALARREGFDFFTVTLTVSRHKDSRILERIGRDVARKVGIGYLTEDFKKQDGTNLSVRLSQELGIYRQDFCGCSLSRREARMRRERREDDAR